MASSVPNDHSLTSSSGEQIQQSAAEIKKEITTDDRVVKPGEDVAEPAPALSEPITVTNHPLSEISESTTNCPLPESTKAKNVDSHPHPQSHTPPKKAVLNGLLKKGNSKEKANRPNRRVTFPMDHTIVSGFMDPPSPWNDSRTCTTEDLIRGYLQACDKFNIKPIPRVLKQLHVITNFCDRNDTLTLRGDRLDVKHCETLEEILRRVQFRTIDFEASHLDEEGAIALFDMIEYYESCIRLNISFNKSIGPRGWHSLSRMIKKTPCLEYLEARSCTISEQVMPMLGRSLRLGSSLRILHLESSIASGRPLMILVAAIKLNDSLKEVFLADNKLMPSDGIQLGNLLKFNHRLAVLDVRNNHLQDVGVSHLCDGLAEQTLGMGLTTLVLWNNQITYQSMQSLGRAISCTHNIETLNLGHNNITTEGIHRLKDGLLHNSSLLRIGLQSAKITCEGAVAIAEYLAEAKRLLRIDLRENEIKTGGLMALSLALKVCTTVNRIDLDQEPKREAGIKDYAEQQRRLLQDISNYTQRNRDLARQQEEQEQLDLQQKLKLEKEADNMKEKEEQEDLTKSKEDEKSNCEREDTSADALNNPGTPNKMMEELNITSEQETIEGQSNISSNEGINTSHMELQIGNDNNGPNESDKQNSEPSANDALASDDACQIPDLDFQHQRRMHLNLPIVSRAQELDSPAFVKSHLIGQSSGGYQSPPPLTFTNEEGVVVDEYSLDLNQVPADFPPSPMVSEKGKAHLECVPASMCAEENPVSPPEVVSPISGNNRRFIVSSIKSDPLLLQKKETPSFNVTGSETEHGKSEHLSKNIIPVVQKDDSSVSSQIGHQLSDMKESSTALTEQNTKEKCVISDDESQINEENVDLSVNPESIRLDVSQGLPVCNENIIANENTSSSSLAGDAPLSTSSSSAESVKPCDSESPAYQSSNTGFGDQDINEKNM